MLHLVSVPLPFLTFLRGERKKQNDEDEQDPTHPKYWNVDSTPPTLLHLQNISSCRDQVRKTRQSNRKVQHKEFKGPNDY